jgi:hypothetical protein
MKNSLLNFFQRAFLFILLSAFFFRTSASANSNDAPGKFNVTQNDGTGFLENKGQMTDMDKNPVPFVLFRASFPGLNVYLTEQGLTYVFIQTRELFEEWEGEDDGAGREKIVTKTEWVNIHLADAVIRKENILAEGEARSVNNYFYPHCSQGIYGVKKFETITVKNIYPGIDWVLYGTEKSGMKYDFIVSAGADASRIKLIYESEIPVTLTRAGTIEINTRLGSLEESAPYSFIRESGQEVSVHYMSRPVEPNRVEVTFDIPAYDLKTLVIDPQLYWGTLYGGGTDELDGPGSIDTDDNGNLLVAGYTTSPDFPLQGNGAYYDSVFTGGVYDLYLMKFTNAGILLWSTYYGGSGNERSVYEVPFVTTDSIGNIFVAGQTFSADLPLMNAGTYYDSTFNGSLNFISDAFILKFDSSSNRLWATYFGGDAQDRAISAATDPSGNLLITGFTNSTALFPYQSWGAAFIDSTFSGGTSDAFIAKFTNSGNLTWSTYLGGGGEDHALSVTADASGNIFLTGETSSPDFPLQNNGTFFDNISGGTDAFVTKFNPAGSLTWSTYLGGSAAFSLEWGISIRVDKSDNIFLMGYTNSTDFPLMNAGTYYDSIIGSADMDLFLTKFDNSGSTLWSTYFGGTGNVSTTWDFMDYDHLEIDTSNAIYISFNRGVDPLPTLDPGCGSYYDTVGRIAVARFSNAGDFLWGTYLGASSNEVRAPLAVDKYNNLFVAGEFNGYSSVAGLPMLNPGGGAYYSTSLGPNAASNHQAFQLKFIPDVCAIVPGFVANDNNICPGTCIDFINTTTGALSYQWFFNGAVPGSSTDVNPQNICYSTPGNYPVTLIASNGISTDTLILNSYIHVYPVPAPQGITQSGDTLFANSGAPGYQWYFNGSLISGATDYFYVASQSGDYNVVATDANGCEVEAAIFNVIAAIEFLPGSPMTGIYPNPVQERFTIYHPQMRKGGFVTISVYSMPGELIRVETISKECDVSLLAPGMYWLEAIFGEEILRCKFVKQ